VQRLDDDLRIAALMAASPAWLNVLLRRPYALTADGHFGSATTVASNYAQRLASDIRDPTPESLSVYGSLLLRGALAAAQAEDRDGSVTLLDEAGQAGTRLGSDFNHRWTAFGPANVLLHRINVAVRLGDAGAAIDHARKVNLDQLTVTERKASFFVDTAHAFSHLGKHDKAYLALRAAEQLAPQELRSRPAVRRLVTDLLATAPPTIRPPLREFASTSGRTRDALGRGPGLLCDRVRGRTRRRRRIARRSRPRARLDRPDHHHAIGPGVCRRAETPKDPVGQSAVNTAAPANPSPRRRCDHRRPRDL
jgi:hypothetical protein